MIKHLPGPFPTRSRAVIPTKAAFTRCRSSPTSSQTCTGRPRAHSPTSMRRCRRPAPTRAASSPAIVYIADMARKPEMKSRLGRMGRPKQSADARVPRRDAGGARPWWRLWSPQSCNAQVDRALQVLWWAKAKRCPPAFQFPRTWWARRFAPYPTLQRANRGLTLPRPWRGSRRSACRPAPPGRRSPGGSTLLPGDELHELVGALDVRRAVLQRAARPSRTQTSDSAAAAYFSNGTRSDGEAPSLTQRSNTKL